MARTSFLDRFNQSLIGAGEGISRGLRSYDQAQIAKAKAAQEAELAPIRKSALTSQADIAGTQAGAEQIGFENRLKEQELRDQLSGVIAKPTSEFGPGMELQPGQIGPERPGDMLETERTKAKELELSEGPIAQKLYAAIDTRKGLVPGSTAQTRKKWELENKRLESGGVDKFGLKPIYGTGPKGERRAMRMTKTGLQALDLPKGIESLETGFQKVDMGDRFDFYDTQGNFIGSKVKGIDPSQQPTLKGAQAKAIQDATGKIPEKDTKEKGKQNVSAFINDMKDYFMQLKEKGGVVDVEKSGISNLFTRLASSDIGQSVQNTFGTDTQSIRNKIKTMKPSLINSIRQATAMGAKGMDSEKELEFYLQAVGDEKRDFQSNMAALSVIDDAYGLGVGISRDKALTSKIQKLKDDFQKSLKNADSNNISLTGSKAKRLQELRNKKARGKL